MKILILRFSSIGDIILTSPIVRCVKNQIKDAEVHFATKASFAGFVSPSPYIDQVWKLQNNQYNEFIADLKRQNFDLILDLHKNLRTKKIIRDLGVESLTFDKLNIKKWIYTTAKINLLPEKHIVDRYFEGIASTGVKNDYHGLDFFIPADTKLPFELPKKYNVFAIGGTYFTKRLPNDQIIAICKSSPIPMILIGGKEDSENGAEIVGSIGPNVVDLIGQLSIPQSAQIIESANMVLTHDTGMMHIAAAFHKKILSFWGNTTPELGMYPYQADPASKIFEVKGLSCRPCSKLGKSQCPKKHFNCMNLIDVDAVQKELLHQ